MIPVYSHNREISNDIVWQNAKVQNIKAGGTYSYRWALKG
jgi:hypothetical protein